MLASHAVVHADFVSETHRISCRLTVGPTGLIGSLNDINSSLLDVENAYISRLQQPAKIVAHFDKASLSKAALNLIILNRREDLGPAGMMRAGYSQLLPVSVMMALGTFEVSGQVEVPNKLDASQLLVGGSTKYIPVYKATAVSTLHSETSFAGEVIVVNRILVMSLAAVARGKT